MKSINLKQYLTIYLFFFISGNLLGQKSLFLHLDKLSYFTEDSVYYSIYSMDNSHTKNADRVAYVVLLNSSSKAVMKVRSDIQDGGGAGAFVLPDSLISGLYQIVGFTRSMKNKNDENYFRQNIYIINRHDRVLDFKLSAFSDIHELGSNGLIHLNDSIFKPRQKVILTLDSLKLSDRVSISVTHKLPIDLNANTLKSYLNTTGKFKGSNGLDEGQGQLLVGKVVDEAGLPVPKQTIILSVVDSIPNIQYAVSDENGLFKLLLDSYYDSKDLFVTIYNPQQNNPLYLVYDDPYDLNSKVNFSYRQNKYANLIDGYRKLSYVNKIFRSELTKERVQKHAQAIQKFHYEQTILVRPSEFEHLDYFEEIVVELMPKLRILSKDGKMIFQVLNKHKNEYDENPPAVFLDGVFLDDNSKLSLLGSDYIERIEMVAEERVFGDLIFGGMVSIHTTNNWGAKAPLASHSLKVKNDKSLNKFETILVNENDAKDLSVPIVERMLYWNPKLENTDLINHRIEFYTPDYVGRFQVQVHGIDDAGKALDASIEFVVKDSK